MRKFWPYLFLIISGCQRNEEIHWPTSSCEIAMKSCNRYLKDNDYKVKILAVDSEARYGTIEGSKTREPSWVKWRSHIHPKVGEVWDAHVTIDCEKAWLELTVR